MIRKCKDIDITDIGLITAAVCACLRPAKKRRRYDTIELFASTLGVSRRQAARSLAARDEAYLRGVDIIARKMQADLLAGTPDIRKPGVTERVDACSHKVRKVAVLNIRNLLYDHVAVIGLAEACRAIGEYQVSSIPGRGAEYGDRAIRKWLHGMRDKNVYHMKLDIRNFYGSVNQELLFAWLARRVANPKLLWLTRKLVTCVDKGMAIGSYLSQTLANLYLSSLYHLAKEGIFRTRRGKRIATFKHALFYMDDMLLIGLNSKAMKRGAQELAVYAREQLGLEIKPGWCVRTLSERHPIDIMGFRYSGGKVSLRRRIFKYARRMLARAARLGMVTLHASCRIASYKGYIEKTIAPKGLDCISIFTAAGKAASIYHERKNALHQSA